MEEIYKIVGKRVKEERKRLKLTQERLAELTDLSIAFIGQIERGDNRASLVTIQKIAEAINIPIGELFKDLPVKKHEYRLAQQLESMLRDKNPKEKQFAKDLLKFFFSKKP